MEQSDQNHFQSTKHIPIDEPEVVARLIGAVIGKVDTASNIGRVTLTLPWADGDPGCHEL